MVTGDASRLRQLLDNLLANVRRHTPAGTPARIALHVDGGVAVMAVADQGPGLTEEQRDRVFEQFYRAGRSRSREQGGAGLGLSIVAAIAAAHGGSAQVTAEPGAGATFSIELPRRHAPARQEPA